MELQERHMKLQMHLKLLGAKTEAAAKSKTSECPKPCTAELFVYIIMLHSFKAGITNTISTFNLNDDKIVLFMKISQSWCLNIHFSPAKKTD